MWSAARLAAEAREIDVTAWDLLTDLGFMCLLLLAGTWLRARLRVLQALFLPASLIAGILGLVLGPNGIGMIPFSGSLAEYSGILIAVVFAAMPFTSRLGSFSQAARNVAATWATFQSVVILYWGVGLLFSLGIITMLFPVMDIPDGFGLILAAGFMGGHGTAAAIADVFGDRWVEAQALGMTAATVGIVVAIVGGILLIKYESQRGRTSYLQKFSDLPRELRTGMVHPDRRQSVGKSPVSTMSIDPLVYHGGVILAVSAVAYLIAEWISEVAGGLSIPTFSVAFLLAILVVLLMRLTKATRHFDVQLFERTSSSASDLLVAFGVASISPEIVVSYAGPLALLLSFGVVFIACYYFLVAKRTFTDHAVEQSLFLWGVHTGTVAMGIALLRIVDPDMKSKTLDYYGAAYVPIGFVDIAIIAVLPVLVIAGWAWASAFALTAVGIGIITLAKLTFARTPAAAQTEKV